MRILIIGDSLPLPRPLKGQPLEKTWPELLKNSIPQAEIWQRARTRSSISDVLREFHFFTESLDRFDAVVVQAGIVDCSPRPYPHFIKKLFELFLAMPRQRRLERVAHKYLMPIYGRPWTTCDEYCRIAHQIVEDAYLANPRAFVAFIATAQPTGLFLSNFKRIAKLVATYNAALKMTIERQRPKRPCFYIDPYTGEDALKVTIEDGHHLSILGHQLVADHLVHLLHGPASFLPLKTAPTLA